MPVQLLYNRQWVVPLDVAVRHFLSLFVLLTGCLTSGLWACLFMLKGHGSDILAVVLELSRGHSKSFAPLLSYGCFL